MKVGSFFIGILAIGFMLALSGTLAQAQIPPLRELIVLSVDRSGAERVMPASVCVLPGESVRLRVVAIELPQGYPRPMAGYALPFEIPQFPAVDRLNFYLRAVGSSGVSVSRWVPATSDQGGPMRKDAQIADAYLVSFRDGYGPAHDFIAQAGVAPGRLARLNLVQLNRGRDACVRLTEDAYAAGF